MQLKLMVQYLTGRRVASQNGAAREHGDISARFANAVTTGEGGMVLTNDPGNPPA
jgi:hypothetical protein